MDDTTSLSSTQIFMDINDPLKTSFRWIIMTDSFRPGFTVNTGISIEELFFAGDDAQLVIIVLMEKTQTINHKI
jgi:hypothetical protein